MNSDDFDLENKSDEFDLEKVMWGCLADMDELGPIEAAERISSRVAKLDRASRISVLIPVLEAAEPDCFWRIFICWWPDFEFPHRWEGLADRLRALHAVSPAYEFMSSANQNFFNSLPEKITVYRGGSRDYPLGISWTTDLAKAQWFAQRFDGLNGFVATGTIGKQQIWAVFTDRNESEILCGPLDLCA